MRFIKQFKVFENSDYQLYVGQLEDKDEDNLVARSDDWNLYAFDSLHEYVKLESRLIDEYDGFLTEGPFSHATQKYRRGEPLGDESEGLNRLFKMYYDRYGKLYFLINMETSENYMFNANERENYIVFNSKLKQIKTNQIIHILKDLDFISERDEKVINSMCDR